MNSWVRHHIVRAISILFVATLFVSCGGSTSSIPSDNLDASGNYISKYETPWHNVFNSDTYSGYLSMMFKSDVDVHVMDGLLKISNDSSRTNFVNDAVSRHKGEIRKGMNLSEETINKAMEKARREGRRMTNWNLYYRIKAEDPGHAEELYYELKNSGLVRFIYPIRKPKLMNGDGTTPDIEGEQLYLQSDAATGGLNVTSAWAEGIKGQGVGVFHDEINWNFTHEDLKISEAEMVCDFFTDCDAYDSPLYYDNNVIQHGTAVVGVIGALDNGVGVTGIANGSKIIPVELDVGIESGLGELGSRLIDYTTKGESETTVKPGDVVVITVSQGGVSQLNGDACEKNPVTGEVNYCPPVETDAVPFLLLRDLTDLGLIIVEAAGNSNYNIGEMIDDNCGADICPDLSLAEDVALPEGVEPEANQIISGAIVVSASKGGKDNTKVLLSNCGTRVDLYGWGKGVTTAGYGGDINAVGQITPNPATDPDDPNKWYTGSFSGTSSATAMVAGAVALVQSAVDKIYREAIPHKKFYYDAWQMRQLLKETGIPSPSNTECNIGYKPDVGAAIQAIKDHTILPHIVPDTPYLTAKPYAVVGGSLDFDGDGKGDLINFDPSIGNESGVWNIDLSSIAPDPSNPVPADFGAWDVQLAASEALEPGVIPFPIVNDYDSDGDADLAFYDANSGKWYIKYTVLSTILGLSKGVVHTFDWDVVIDYSLDAGWKRTSRPLPADYDGDGWLDIGMTTPTGRLLVDFGGGGRIEKDGPNVIYKSDFDGIEFDENFLTTEQQKAAPGWAYTAFNIYYTTWHEFHYRIPDGLPNDSGKIYVKNIEDIDKVLIVLDNFDYGDNNVTLIPFGCGWKSWGSTFMAQYPEKGVWQYATGGGGDMFALEQPLNNGLNFCNFALTDYDADSEHEIGIMCRDQWYIIDYEIIQKEPYLFFDSMQIISLGNNATALPPTIYPGGIKYQDIKAILEYYGLWDKYQDVDPIGPYTVECLNYWAVHPTKCLNKVN